MGQGGDHDGDDDNDAGSPRFRSRTKEVDDTHHINGFEQ